MARQMSREQYERHSLHLMHCLLSFRPGSSPFTLILDTLDEPAQPFRDELVMRAHSRGLNVVQVTLEYKHSSPRIGNSLHLPIDLAHDSAEEILSVLETTLSKYHDECVVFVDNLDLLLNFSGVDMNALFSLVCEKHKSSFVGIWHTDIEVQAVNNVDVYEPQTLDVLKYMATTIITVTNVGDVVQHKQALMRSVAPPSVGLLQESEGVVMPLRPLNIAGVGELGAHSMVLDAEFRRKSGRSEKERYVLRRGTEEDYYPVPAGSNKSIGPLKKEYVILLDHFLPYKRTEFVNEFFDGPAPDSGDMETTFKLGLTDKQKEDRENVVLPYFDAQKNMGEAGEGGRILYNMGEEDDFDEEEDEI